VRHDELALSKRCEQSAYAETLVPVGDVESGLKCGCLCPACKAPLVAKKGKKNQHHFSHYGQDECEHGVETALHLAAKDIIAKHKKLHLPCHSIAMNCGLSFDREVS
jgi:hypothetical protein